MLRQVDIVIPDYITGNRTCAPAHKYPSQVSDDRKRRDATRASYRASATLSGNPILHHALKLAENGYGVDDVQAKSGVSRDIAVGLVLGVTR
jgi:hypothetical protein